jgi:16S rRNA G966 N2-methylase RsmD
MKITDETKKFIQENSEADTHKLALKSAHYPHIDMPFTIQQIDGRKKIKNKIPTFYANENVVYPSKISLEQTSSELTARYKAALCKGKIFIDLTGGFGCDCYFISQNFQQANFVEYNKELCRIVVHNFEALHAKNINVICSKAEDYILKIKEKVDLVYLDPARRSNTGSKTVLVADCTPNVAEMVHLLIMKSSTVLIKLSPLIDISAAIKELKYVSEVHVLAVENECKEVLLLLKNKRVQSVLINAANLHKNNEKQSLVFKITDESRTEAFFAEKINEYLYEPNNAILKAGAFKILTHKFEIKKLDINTHLYTSDQIIENFPGRIFRIEEVIPFSKKVIKTLKIKFFKANITVRNFPLNVQEIRTKTGLKDGGDVYIFASRFKNENLLIVCKKI